MLVNEISFWPQFESFCIIDESLLHHLWPKLTVCVCLRFSLASNQLTATKLSILALKLNFSIIKVRIAMNLKSDRYD